MYQVLGFSSAQQMIQDPRTQIDALNPLRDCYLSRLLPSQPGRALYWRLDESSELWIPRSLVRAGSV
jgi:hypothetical protein